jgi:RHS repeat-associated protein
LGKRTTSVYDAASRRTALVDPRANRYTFGYDNASHLVKQVDPLNRVTTFGFDAASERTLRIDARGNRSTFTFDSDSRPTGTRYPDGTRVTMAYDSVGNRRFHADSTGRYTTLYDSLNRARAVTTPANLTITLAFDTAGRRRTLVEPSGGTFTYGYDLANRGTLVVNPQSERTSWTYDAASRATLQRLSNLIRVSMAYDSADRLVRLANITSTGTTITSFRDTWDGAGNRLHRVEADGTRVTWSYDVTNQLTRERRNGANSYDTTYSYDAAGNRLVKLDNAVRTTYTCDAANQLSKYVDNTGTTTLTYDATGSQQTQKVPSGGITTNTWDFESRLTKVLLPSAVRNTFSYNADGLRVQRQDSTGTLKEVWDGQKILLETDQNDVTQSVYTELAGGLGGVVSQRRSGTGSYFLFDPLGSTSRLADGSANVTDTYLYKAFGEVLLAGSTANPFQFVGKAGYYRDIDTGMDQLMRRFLQPLIGRFASAEPFGVVSREANLYRYVMNNAVNQIDPSGMLPSFITNALGAAGSLFGGAVGGALGGAAGAGLGGLVGSTLGGPLGGAVGAAAGGVAGGSLGGAVGAGLGGAIGAGAGIIGGGGLVAGGLGGLGGLLGWPPGITTLPFPGPSFGGAFGPFGVGGLGGLLGGCGVGGLPGAGLGGLAGLGPNILQAVQLAPLLAWVAWFLAIGVLGAYLGACVGCWIKPPCAWWINLPLCAVAAYIVCLLFVPPACFTILIVGAILLVAYLLLS